MGRMPLFAGFGMIFAGVTAVGAGSIVAVNRYTSAAEQAQYEIAQTERAVRRGSVLFREHNAAYHRVGERTWEEIVRPEVFRRLTLRTIQETGIPIPGPLEVVEWANEHPKETAEILNEYR